MQRTADFNFGFDIVDEWARQEPGKDGVGLVQ